MLSQLLLISSGTEDKQNRLSWLRRSMKKLDPLQLPQVQDDMILLEMPFPSTSNMDSDRRLNRPEPSRDEQEINQICISNPDLFNIVLMEQQQNSELNRPRQYGRRSEPIHLSRDAIHSSNIGAAVSCCFIDPGRHCYDCCLIIFQPELF